MKAAIMGYGTIGSGVAEILDKNADVIAKQAGEPIELKYVLDLREFEHAITFKVALMVKKYLNSKPAKF